MRNRISKVSATAAARDFSRLLDKVEAGLEAVIVRRSRPVAVIGPAPFAPRRASECLAIKLARPSVAPDPGFARDLEKIIRGNPADKPPSWD